mgnify:CR=1 FL=1
MVLAAPDHYYAAAVLNDVNFYLGKGDRTLFFDCITSSDPNSYPDLARKLALVTKVEYLGFKFYNDKLAKPERVNRQTVFKIWLHLRRKHKHISLEQLKAFAPYQEENLDVWDKYVDENGRTTLNMEEYMAYRKVMAEKAKLKAKKKDANKKKKGKL